VVPLLLASVAPSSAAPAPRTRERDRAPEAGPPPDGGEAAPRDRVTVSREARARSGEDLTPDQRRQLQELESSDLGVRAHEAAHQAAGGALAGGASFTYEVGPDGRSYAVAGEVPIRMQQGGTPDEVIANARQVRRAALAPADPSAQDLSVAAQAASAEQAAQARKAREAARAYARHGRDGSLTPSSRSPPPTAPACPS